MVITESLRKLPSLFRMVWSMTPYDLSFPKWGPKRTPCDMSYFEWPYLHNGWSHPLYVCRIGFSGSADRITLFPFLGSWWWPWQLTRHDMSPFILAIAILDFWWMSMSCDTGSGTIKKVPLKYGDSLWNSVVMCFRIWDMSGSKIPPVAGKRRKKNCSRDTDVTIIEIEIEIVFLTEHRIESKSTFRASRQTICPLKHWIAYWRRRASTLQRTDCSAGGRR